MQRREVVSKTLILLEDGAPEKHFGYFDQQRGQYSSAHAVFPTSSLYHDVLD